MLEIITVLIIIGMLAAIAAIRLGGITDESENNAAAAALRAHLRYAQIRALNTQGVWGIDLNGTSYSLFRGTSATVERLPGEDNNSVGLPAGASVGNGFVSFDEWGRPYTTDGATGSVPAAIPNISINGKTIIITPETGYIP